MDVYLLLVLIGFIILQLIAKLVYPHFTKTGAKIKQKSVEGFNEGNKLPQGSAAIEISA